MTIAQTRQEIRKAELTCGAGPYPLNPAPREFSFLQCIARQTDPPGGAPSLFGPNLSPNVPSRSRLSSFQCRQRGMSSGATLAGSAGGPRNDREPAAVKN